MRHISNLRLTLRLNVRHLLANHGASTLRRFASPALALFLLDTPISFSSPAVECERTALETRRVSLPMSVSTQWRPGELFHLLAQAFSSVAPLWLLSDLVGCQRLPGAMSFMDSFVPQVARISLSIARQCLQEIFLSFLDWVRAFCS